jgi:chromosomal replication initiation ATPase DnaA
VPVDLIAERTRKIEIVRCRQLCFYFFVNKLHYGTVRAGKIFNLDHATVLHALKKVTTKYKDDMIELNKML